MESTAEETTQTRRYPRGDVHPGSAFVEFAASVPEGVPERAPVTKISLAGFRFEVQGIRRDLKPGTVLPDVVVRFGGCDLRGDVQIQNSRLVGTSRTEIGCLFSHPTGASADLPKHASPPEESASSGVIPTPPEVEYRATHYDRAFAPAVEQGLLSAREATQRGHRDSYASRLAQQHDLSREAAYAVADNRVTLSSALHSKGETAVPQIPHPERTAHPKPAKILILATILAAFVLFVLALSRTTEHGTGLPVGTEVRTDELGRVVQVVGPDPLAVLEAFCDNERGVAKHEAVGLLPASLASSRVRVGILRDRADHETLLAIPIRRDGDRSRWVAGDGRNPLNAVRAPEGARGALESGER